MKQKNNPQLKTFAVIKVSGLQHVIAEGDVLELDSLPGKEGEKIVFDEVLLYASGKDYSQVQIGAPVLEDVQVEGKIIKHGKLPKVTIFKYKPKKRYRVKKGHRQPFTQVEIVKIKTKRAAKKQTALKKRRPQTKEK